MKPLRWRTTFLLALTALALYAVTPTVMYFLQPKEVRNDPALFLSKLPSWLPQSHVKLGLDLVGGVQLVLGVNTADAIENKLSEVSVDLTRWAQDNKVEVQTAYVAKGSGRLTVILKPEIDTGKFNEDLRKEFPLLQKLDRKDQTLTYGYSDSEVARIKQSALEQAERVVRDRVDRLGVSETIINRRADGSVLVQLPGFKNPEEAKKLLGRTAQLRFQIVDDTFTGFADITDSALPEGIKRTNNGNQVAFEAESREALQSFLQPKVPNERQLLFSREKLGAGAEARYKWTSYVLDAAVIMNGSDIQDASLGQGGGLDRMPVVSLTMTGPGGRRFAEATGKNVQKRMAIVLDDVVESAPVIEQKISGGHAQIRLGGSRSYNELVEEGSQLALLLKSGAIPATITVLEEREVGASLGPELANQGIKGALAGLLFVFLFMIFYYKRPGVIACIALLLNAIFLLAAMAGFGFALSLPGIAGFILTLGMAVDANVLINERISQEIREGKHPRKAVEASFDKVFWTILDAHVTALLAGLVLLETNASGSIRGFAITLMVGLLISLFTSLTCTRHMFMVALSRVSDKNIRAWLGVSSDAPVRTMRKLNFNFMKLSTPLTLGAFVLSGVILSAVFIKGLNFGVDFAGGTEAVVAFQKDIESDEIRKIAEDTNIAGFSIQALGEGKRQYLLRYEESHATQTSDGSSATASEIYVAFKSNILSKLGEYQPEFQRVDFVGPQVGKELRTQGILSVLYAILAILLYIGLRFDMRFGPGAAVKMFIDIFLLLGVYVFFWQTFDLVSVAAFLTVVGYSVNDTIVIYDRIRENLLENPRRPLRENLNISLNETLSRSLNTSFVTASSLFGILFFATGQIRDFALVMTLGIVFATFSSTFIAPLFVLWFEQWREKKAPSTITSPRTA